MDSLDEFAQAIVPPVLQELKYAYNYKRYISDLDSQMESLVDRRKAVQLRVHVSEENLETILPEVKTWLRKVEAAIQEKETTFREESVSNRFVPNPMTYRSLGKKAKKMTDDVQQLLIEGNFASVGIVARSGTRIREEGTSSGTLNPTGFESTASVIEVGTSTGTSINTDFESRASIIKSIMDALKDESTNPVIICGMSGIGKSTMLREISNSKEAKSLFNDIPLVEISRSEEYLYELQKEIAECLNLKRLAEHTNLVEREKLLYARLTPPDKKVLLILDDVLERIDFEKVGIPLHEKQCKVLISTRSQHLYSEMTSKKKLTLNFLREEEAWRLFKEMAGDSIESPELRPIAKEVLRHCDGLPLAISIIGRALHGCRDKDIWKDAVTRLKKPGPQNIPEVTETLRPKIKLSCDEKISFFFLCSIYPEGSKIQVEDLVRHGLGLGLFVNIGSMKEVRPRVKCLIAELKKRSLLLDSMKQGCVKMHDMVRHVALSSESPPSSETASRTQIINTFFSRHGVEHINGWLKSSETTLGAEPFSSSETQFLVLSGKDHLTNPIEDIIKVLDLKSTNSLSVMPTLPLFKSIRTLRLENWALGDASIIGELRTLVTLSLCNSSMNELPPSFRKLSNLWLLDLTGCRILNAATNSSGITSSLKNLQELYLLGHPGENFFGELIETYNESDEIVSELSSCQCHLTTLEVNLPKVSEIALQRSELFDQLERFKISIGCDGPWDIDPPRNNCLRLKSDANSLVGSRITQLLKKTETLELRMRNLGEALNILDGECFKGLKDLRLDNCNILRYIVDTTTSVQDVFHVLHTLTIKSSMMLTSICNGQPRMGCFQELRRVELHSCDNLKFLFPLSMVKEHLHQLEELDVQYCPKLEEIAAFEGQAEKIEINLPNLIGVNLVDLYQFLGFSHVNISLPLLVGMHLENLPKLITLYPDNSAESAPQSSSSASNQHLFDTKDESFLELRHLEVISCDSITRMFASDTLQSLQKLEHLRVEYCRSLTTIFEVDDEAEHVSLKLSCMEKLILSDLPVLEYIWKPLWEAEAFQSLRILKIDCCGRLKFVFPTYIAELLLNLEKFFVCDCESMEEIICKSNRRGDKKGKARTMEKVVFSRVKSLQLKKLPSLVQFFGAPCMVQWPSLRELVLEDLPKVKTHLTNHTDDAANDTRFQSHVFNEKNGSVLALRSVKVIRCHSISSMSSSNSIQSIQNLEDLNIEDCQSLTTVFDLEEQDIIANHVSKVLSRIQEMTLICLPELKYIWKPSLKIQAFQILRILKVSSCGKLRYVFPPHIAEGLIKLEEFCVNDCSLMKEIICGNEKSRDQEDETTTTTKKVVFSQVKSLKLTKIRSLIRFCSAPCIIEWPSLRQLVLEDLSAVETCFINQLSDVADTQRQSHVFNLKDGDFTELKKVQVIRCNSVSCLFPSSSILALQNLDHLSVEKCHLVKTLFDFEDSDVKASKQASLMLSCIELMHLPWLEHLWKAHTKVQAFQNLKILKIEHCGRLKYAFQPHIAEGLVKLEEFSISECPKMTEVICGNGSRGDQEDETTRTNEVVFSKVRLLELKNLDWLKCFCGAPCMVRWPSLTTLVLGDLHKLEACFINHSRDVADIQAYFFNEKVDCPSLKELVIRSFPCLKEIWSRQILHHFSELRDLCVEFCKELVIVIPSHMQQRLQKLESLKVFKCSSAEDIFERRGRDVDEEEAASAISRTEGNAHPICGMDFNQTPSFQNLRQLEVTECEKLQVLLSYSMAKGLVKLEKLSVSKCWRIEKIVSEPAEGEEAEDNITILPQLTSSSGGKYDLHLPQLVRFEFERCPRMRTFYSGSVHTPKLKEVVELRYKVVDRRYTINDPSNWDLNRLIHQQGKRDH